MSALVMPSSGHHTLSGLLMTTPAILTTSALTAAPRALRWFFVGAEAKERRLAELAVGGPLGVRELGYELRPNPRGVTDRRWRIERRFVRPQPLELLREHLESLLGEARADLPDVSELRAVVQPDEKRAQVLAATLWRRVPADHELGLLADLHLPPEGRSNARLVMRALVLRDDSLPTSALGLAICGLSIADDAPRDEERVGSSPQKPLERRTAFGEGTPHQRTTLEDEEIEHRVARRRATGRPAALKQLKA